MKINQIKFGSLDFFIYLCCVGAISETGQRNKFFSKRVDSNLHVIFLGYKIKKNAGVLFPAFN
jgi:hypothetical protein